MIVEHITYDRIEGEYDSTIFTAEKHTGFDKAYRAQEHIRDYVFADGAVAKSVERKFAEELDGAETKGTMESLELRTIEKQLAGFKDRAAGIGGISCRV